MDNAEISLQEQAATIRREALLPTVSLVRYEEAFCKFIEWPNENHQTSLPDENMLLVYLKYKSCTLAPSSLWSLFSMLKRQFMVSVP